jgi:hypothetical protein
MRFMILVRASPGSESGAMPSEEQIAEQLAFHQAIDEAGVLIDAMGFHPTSKAWRVVQRTDGSREVIEGPFHDEHLIAGYTLIDVASREEAMDWSLRYAKTSMEHEHGEIEVRQLFDLDEFVQGPAVQGFRELDLVGRIAADVGRSRPDLSRAVSPDGTVTVLFTDIEGSTQLTESLGDAEWIRVLRGHNALVRDQVAAHSGIEVKSQGDGSCWRSRPPRTPCVARSRSSGRSSRLPRMGIGSACGSGSTRASRSARRTTSTGSP